VSDDPTANRESAAGDDPTVIDSIAVHTEDIVAAVEARDRNRRDAVLRITPPFAGRMRARIHVAGEEAEYGDPAPIHVEPRTLVSDVPSFPGRNPESWRSLVASSVREEIVIETERGPISVRVHQLG
jgi:hypothetical protein